MIITTRSYPRIGLVGNPSDGYFGKTIAFTFANFCAEVVLYETPELEILPSIRDHSRFGSVGALVEDVRNYGYYGGIRLLKAAVKRFATWCAARGIELEEKNFTLRYQSNIPHQVGLAGSSAIITASMRALMRFYGVGIEPAELANLVLSVELAELGISAGLQDRVAQAYGGIVYMDFDRSRMERTGSGRYERIPKCLVPPLYLAYRTAFSESSSVFHNNIRDRFDRGEKAVVSAMRYWAGLTDKVRAALLDGRPEEVGPLLDANFDRRRTLYRLAEADLAMVDVARSLGASAKFTGSGGALVGTYPDEATYRRLKKRLREQGVRVVKPRIVQPRPEDTAPARPQGEPA